MKGVPAMTIEDQVLASLRSNRQEMDLDELISRVRGAGQEVRAVDVKIAALGLVSRGAVKLNDAWKLTSF